MSTSRTIRRAIERKQAKQARKEARLADTPGSEVADASSSTQKENLVPDHADAPPSRPVINRLNALHSTGPTSAAGKATSSMNALKTGLTGRTVLLPADDVAAYEKHIARFVAEHKPVGDRESELVQSLADARWRLNRIPSLESGIYALGRLQFAELFPGYEPDARAALIQAHTHLQFQKQLTNLALQEARLRRNFEKDLAELGRLQAERIRTSKSRGRDFSPSPVPNMTTAPVSESFKVGFEFSSTAQADAEQAPAGSERYASIRQAA